MTQLPGTWDETTLGEIAEIVRGVTYKREQAESEPGPGLVPLLRATNISQSLTFEDLVYVPESCVSDLQMLKQGDIVIAASSGSKSVVGKAALLNSDWLGTFGAFCAAVRPAPPVAPKFVGYYLQTSEYRNFVSERSSGVNINNLKAGDLAAFRMRIAPRAEQDRIVAEIEKQFTRLDAATAALKRVQANLKRYRASVLKAACEGRLVPTEAELARKEGRDYEPADQLLQRILRERRARWEADTLAKMIASGKPPKDDRWKQKYKEPTGPDLASLPPLPIGWCWTSADQLCTQITDGEHIQPPYRPHGQPLLTAKHVQDGCIDFREYGLIAAEDFAKARARCAPQESDVLIVSVGATTGRSGIVRQEPPFAIVRSVLLLRPLIEPRYFLSWVQSPWCQHWIGYASGSTAQAHFYIGDAKRMPIPLPPAEEQHSIVQERDRILSGLDVLEREVLLKVKASAGLRQSILSAAFSGQLVPQVAGDEPASVLLERIRAKRIPERNPSKSARKEEPSYA